MSAWPAAVQAHLSARLPFVMRHLFWCQAKRFDTGAVQGVGLWTGDDNELLAIEGQARTYAGAQGAFDVPAARFQVGTQVAETQVGIVMTPEGENLVMAYNTRLAPFQIHWAVFEDDGLTLIGVRRMFTGIVAGVLVPTPEQDGAPRLTTIDLTSVARWGTTTVAGHKSDASQRLRDPDDTLHADSGLGTVASDPWATK